MSSLGFKLKIYDASPDQQWAQSLKLSYSASLDEVLSDVDIISLHCPLTPSTHHLINEDVLLHKLSKPVILINTSRGALIDSHALIKALNEGKVLAAGLDVFEGEDQVLTRGGKVPDTVKALLNLDNVILTPHMAYFTMESLNRIWEATLCNLERFFLKKEIDPKYIVV